MRNQYRQPGPGLPIVAYPHCVHEIDSDHRRSVN